MKGVKINYAILAGEKTYNITMTKPMLKMLHGR